MRAYNWISGMILCASAILTIHSIRYARASGPVHKKLPPEYYRDTGVLYFSLKGTEDHEDNIIEVVVRRNNTDRRLILHLFELLYEKDLLEELRHRIYNNFRRTILGLFMKPYDFLAQEFFMAVSGLGTDEHSICNNLVPLNKSEIRQVSTAYFKMYERTLKDDLLDDISGQFMELIIAILDGKRDEGSIVDHKAVVKDVNELIEATDEKIEIERVEVFNKVFSTSSYAQLKAVFQEYKKLTEVDIVNAILLHIHDPDIRYTYLTIVNYIMRPKKEFYAMLLNEAISGFGTDDFLLIRIIVSRSEIDLNDIQQTYLKMYGNSLADDVQGDTSGFYMETLLAILNKVKLNGSK